MSLARPAIALTLTAALAAGVVVHVHRTQELDRARMHRAVERDVEEERRRKQCAESGGVCELKPSATNVSRGSE